MAPQAIPADTLLDQLHCPINIAFGVNVHGVDVDAGMRSADIQQMGRRTCEANEIPLMEDRDHDRAIGRMGGAIVGVVVEDNVTLVDVTV